MDQYMPLNEFRTSGLLQEINRQILHPMGLELVVALGEGDEVTALAGIRDYRSQSDPNVVLDEPYHRNVTDDHLTKARNVKEHLARRIVERRNKLGFGIQPIPGLDEPAGSAPKQAAPRGRVASE